MQNPFQQTHFLLSCAQLEQLPDDDLPEIAFAGRSNAGKSSALNALCTQKQLARVSKTPGRTQLINLFVVPNLGRLADLPGYGYAKVPMPVRKSWGALIGGFVETRANLRGIVIIMDIRHPMTDYDLQMLGWTHTRGLACHILLTKADKLGYGAAKNQLHAVKKELAAAGIDASVQLFSATTSTGIEEARSTVEALLKMEVAPAPLS